MYRIVLLFGIFLIIGSCDERPIDIPEFIPPESDKVVLVEEFTGIRCVNCPGGARELENLKALYGDNLVVVGVHSGFFADPYPESRFDFRTPEGEGIESYVGQVLGYPAATVDRKTFGSNADGIVDKAQWASLIAQELENEALVFLNIDHTYNPETREIRVTVIMRPEEQIDYNLRMGLMITENDILDAQLDIDGKHLDYKHKHVLRDYFTDFKGDNINGAPYIPEQTYTRSFSYTLPEEDGWWVAENIDLVAFIAGGETDTKEIIQAAEVKLIQD
jgi:thiol-disulfide isomerase/thioredoxin